jgi:hypothetical protein
MSRDTCKLRIVFLSRFFRRHFSKKGIDKLGGLNFGHMELGTGPYVQNWATEQGSDLSQIRVHTWLAQACSVIRDLFETVTPQTRVP